MSNNHLAHIYINMMKFLLSKQAEDETLKSLQLDIERVEKRVLQYGIRFNS